MFFFKFVCVNVMLPVMQPYIQSVSTGMLQRKSVLLHVPFSVPVVVHFTVPVYFNAFGVRE